MRPMPLSLARDLEDLDLGWSVVELAVVGGAADAVAVCAVSFDHSGVGAVSSWRVRPFDDLVGGFFECGGESFRGKARLVGDLAADRAVATDEG